MQGQVFVQYTRIGGFNMDSGLTTLGVEGSTNKYEEDANLSFTVQWQLPGGIMLKGLSEPEGAWGYILGRKHEIHIEQGAFDDDEFCAYLARRYGYVFDAENKYNLLDTTREAEMISVINKLVSEYFYRVFWNASPTDPEYNWNAMNAFYKSCMFQ